MSMKMYLGDAVYADFDGCHIVLTTQNGIEATKTIALEPQVLAALDRFRERVKQELKAHGNPPV